MLDNCVLCRHNLYVMNLFIYSNDSQIISANILYLLFTDTPTSENASDMLKFVEIWFRQRKTINWM